MTHDIDFKTEDEDGADQQLTFEFWRNNWGDLSVNDKNGGQELHQIKAMQQRRLILASMRED